MYDSSTKIILVNKDGTTGNIGYTINDVNFNQSLVTTYSSIVKGKSVIKNIVNSKDIDTTINWCVALGAQIRKDDDRIIIVGSIPKLISGRTNFIRVHRIGAQDNK